MNVHIVIRKHYQLGKYITIEFSILFPEVSELSLKAPLQYAYFIRAWVTVRTKVAHIYYRNIYIHSYEGKISLGRHLLYHLADTLTYIRWQTQFVSLGRQGLWLYHLTDTQNTAISLGRHQNYSHITWQTQKI